MIKENNCNKTISCYQRPIIFYIINNIKNKRKTNKEKSFNFSNNNNEENININLINKKFKKI